MKVLARSNEIWGNLGRVFVLILCILGGAFLLKWGVGYVLQSYHFDVPLLMILLIVFLIFLFKKLKSGVLVFFLASLLALILFDKTLFDYAKWLYGQASDTTVFMIILFGGTLALISRTDLIDRLKSEKERNLSRKKLQSLQDEVDTFCLLRRFDKAVQRRFEADTKKNHIAKFFLTLIPVIANFVSSAAAVLFFKSLWTPGLSDFVTDEQNRKRAAGILCLCVSGCLLVFLPCVGVKSVWWIFFDSTVASENLMPQIPVAVLLYAFLSYLHGYILIFGSPKKETQQGDEPSDSHNPMLYLMILAVCFVVIGGSMAYIARSTGAPPEKAASVQDTSAVSVPASAQTQSSETAKSDKKMLASIKVKTTKLMVCAVFLCLILAFLIAQILMYSYHVKSDDETWKAGSYGNLLLQGMSGVFNTVVVLVVILAFKDIIVDALPDSSEFAAADSLPWKIIFTSLAILMTGVGCWIGSSFGVFALGFTVFSIAGVTDPVYYRTVVEILILSATFWNQRSPNADNVQMMLGNDNSTKGNVNRVWSVQSIFGKAQNVQVAILVVSIAVVTLLRFQWPGVF
ncbi:hypothetical protein QUF90_12460 [Desulfococcaceae bacterium HSG9]|nr:hypothetical protein [Desulfococcaceae bacterium HSG9]